MRRSYYLLFSILTVSVYFLFFPLQSCKHDPVGLDKLDTVCFKTQVAPLLEAQCSECHSGTHPKGNYVIDSVYADVIKLVKAGSPWSSKLYTIVSSPNNPNMMPPNKSLTKNQLTILEVWIAQGAMNTLCSSDTANQAIASTDGTVLYATYCANCHGILATSSKIGFSATQIQTGINTVPDMKSLSILSTAQKQAIADALAGTPDPNPDGTALYATSCYSCHGALATSTAGKASATRISQAIASVSQMSYLSTLSTVQINAISVALQSSTGSGD
jgi:mono/diheme cytochrome c family protein